MNKPKAEEVEQFESAETSVNLLAHIIFSLLVLIPVYAIYSGFVFMKLWNWFLPYVGLEEISFTLAIGIRILLSQILLNRKNNTSEMNSWKDKWEMLGLVLGANTLFLLMGYIVYLFI